MRIDFKKYPILEFLKKPIPSISVTVVDKPFLKNGLLFHITASRFNEKSSTWSKSIRYIAKSIFDPILEFREKLLQVDLLTGLNECGTLIFPEGKYCFYDIKYNYGDVKNVVSFNAEIWFFYEGVLYSYYRELDRKIFSFDSYIHGEKTQIGSDRTCLFDVVSVLLFCKYADIEVNNIPPNRQVWDGINCLYNNKINSNIQIIDSTWFTTLVKSDGFKVRGHFRLQPYGEGHSKRKLIWVNEFKKDGYTRVAKKLSSTPPQGELDKFGPYA